MTGKDRIDAAGASWLVGFALLFAVNQVLIRWTNQGLQPVFYAGVRSLLAMVPVALWMIWRGIPLRIAPGTIGAGLLIGLAFSAEFLFLFLALDMTTVVHTTILFYAMPVWLALAGHFFLPEERITPAKAAGLALAFAGVVWAIVGRGGAGGGGAGGGGGGSGGGIGNLAGDFCAVLGSMGWAATAFMARGSAMRRVRPEEQLMWMLAVSAVVMIGLSPLFGPLIRDLVPLHLVALAVQAVVVVAGGYIGWLLVLSIYPPAAVASFSFLTPLFAVLLGWLLLGEPVRPGSFGSLALVAAGIVVMNRAPKPV